MSKPIEETDALTDQIRDSLCVNKPDFRELDLGSPVSPLRPTATTTTTTTTTSSSSSSSGSASAARIGSNPLPKASHSGDISYYTETSPLKNPKPTSRSDPLIYSGTGNQSSVNSPSPVNVLPSGNICPSGKILKPGLVTSHRSSKSDVLGSGMGHYGHGSIMRRGGSVRHGNLDVGNSGYYSSCGGSSVDPEELKRAGNEMHQKGHFGEALGFYDKAIALAPGNAAYRYNRAAALMGLGRLAEAVRECEEAVKLDPHYWRAHHRLGSLFIRLGHVENARRHLSFAGHHQDEFELQKLQVVEKHLNTCSDARKFNDWKKALREADAAISAGADYSPQLFMCRAEALLKLHQLKDAETCLTNMPKLELHTGSFSQSRFFGMLSEAYFFLVRAQMEMALGRFESALSAAEKAGQIDPRNVEVAVLLKNVKLVSRARSRGNDLFRSERYTEACSAYGEGLRLDPWNSVLYCNRAACWFKLGSWDKSIDDCNQALCIQPNYTKALLRRAASNSKLEKWSDAVRDYEVLRRELPDDNEVAESLFHAQVALKKSRGEEVYNMKFGGEVEEIVGLEQFKAALSLPGVSVVHFKSSSNLHCKQISPFLDTLCSRYPSINFLQVDIEENSAVASAENVRTVPTFKIYKNGNRVKEIVCPSREMLEHSVRHYSS
ncbi:TPR repeat-containing thioredoxin TTL1-like [Mercurialis annua]|uniref:TPR repeat-containing thioredoxin TTL1-like n=1 Tax=Mercurialis annua TaxID=3986 RepID=UPI002160591B|nr:TPR repeat-containing thioredoxin TTL1-like [Mercurialis annua]